MKNQENQVEIEYELQVITESWPSLNIERLYFDTRQEAEKAREKIRATLSRDSLDQYLTGFAIEEIKTTSNPWR